jgi:hypothetical protein
MIDGDSEPDFEQVLEQEAQNRRTPTSPFTADENNPEISTSPILATLPVAISTHFPAIPTRLFPSGVVVNNRHQATRYITMISEKQLDANRRNALLSTGAKTDEGRNRSRMNALRHGLTGQVTTMTDEDRSAHDQFSEALIASLAPDGAMEIQLAQRVATDSWRLNRASAIEDNLFALGQLQNAGQACPDVPQIDAALISARVFTLESKQLQLLTLYEQRINRSLQKNLAMLQSLQSARKAAHEAAMKEAATLLKLSEMKGLEYFPSKDGFVFSNDQIHAAIDREQRLQRASATDFSRYKPRKLHAQAA